MALSWTGVARNYRILQHNSIIPSPHLSLYINSKSCNAPCKTATYTKTPKETNIKPHHPGCQNVRHYSRMVWKQLPDENENSFSKYIWVSGCQNRVKKVPLVKQKSNFHKSSACKSTRLTPTEATNILRKNEYTTDELWTDSGKGYSPVKSFDMNSIRSNNPTEDAHSEAIIRFGTTAPNGMLFGIFDGHGGAACGQVR